MSAVLPVVEVGPVAHGTDSVGSGPRGTVLP